MSYLQIPNGIPDFDKAVISLWFRAPKQSVIAAASAGGISAGQENFGMMYFTLPLVTFGQPQQNKNYSPDAEIDVGVRVDETADISGIHMRSPGWTSRGNFDVDPCMICLVCFRNGQFQMAFNIQTGVEMLTSSSSFITTQIDDYDNTKFPPPYEGPLGVGGWSDNYTHTNIEDASYADNDQPQYFRVENYAILEPDQWHHILLSFDVGGTVSIGNPFASSTCQMWYAIDDKDYRGQDQMGPYRGLSRGGPGVDNLGDNAIVTYKAWRLSGPPFHEDAGFQYDSHLVAPPSGRYSPQPGAIPTQGYPFGIPAAPKYVDAIYWVELAEFQMWTGVTLDTGVQTNRRAFLDYERDEDGNIVRDEDGKATLKPVPPATAEEFMGRKPAVLLHGSNKWINGENTGTTGLDYGFDPPIEKLSGQFQPTGEIRKYTPDPSIQKT